MAFYITVGIAYFPSQLIDASNLRVFGVPLFKLPFKMSEHLFSLVENIEQLIVPQEL